MLNDNAIEMEVKKSKEYIEIAKENEKDGGYGKARKYYCLAASILLNASKKSKGETRNKLHERADRLIEKAENLPEKIKDRSNIHTKKIEGKKDFKNKWTFIEKPNVKLNDVAGFDEIKQKIEEIIDLPMRHIDKAKYWNVKIGGGVLLYGPPGTGKTYLAKAVAGQLDVPFFSIKIHEIMSKWVGESEKIIANLFETIRQYERSVLFIDEVDALFPKRSGQPSTIMKRVVPQFLSELDGVESDNKGMLVMGATNVPWDMDKGFWRAGRFDYKYYIELPEKDARKKMFELRLKDKNFSKEFDFDYDYLGEITEGYCGADINLMCIDFIRKCFRKDVESGKDVANENLNITTEDIEEVIKNIIPSVSKEDVIQFERFQKRIKISDKINKK